MQQGERQVAPTLDGIRRDHVARFEWAAHIIGGRRRVLDIGCGIGYGSQILANAGNKVIGVDREVEAIDYAEKHYAHETARFHCRDVALPGSLEDLGGFDVAVAFEIVEHLEDPRPMLKAAREVASVLLVSVPNEAGFPWRGHKFHHRHYTKDELSALLLECGWEATGWHEQEGPESDVVTGAGGKSRTLVAQCVRVPVENRAAEEIVAKPAAPAHVAILGLGPSVRQFLEITKRVGGRSAYCDEVWTINAIGDVFACDRIFHMDDVRVQQIRAEAAPDSNIARMIEWMRHTSVPIMTSRAHPDYPSLVEFPLEEVVSEFKRAYFNSTAAYAVAYAIWIGVKKISIFGFDFTYPNAHHAEKGRACVEFWLGIAAAEGIELAIPHESSLMDACHPEDRFYGYDGVDVKIAADSSGRVRLNMTERDSLPTAEEIEARYDHAVD